MPSPAKLEIDDLSMRFPTPAGGFVALDHVSLTVPQGGFISLVGPSGCGKSTIFNIVAGLQEPTSGRVMIDGFDSTGTIGRVGYMLQKDLLLPWRTLTDNIILGMEIQGVPLREARARALPLLRRYGLAVVFVTHDVEEAIFLSDEVHVMGTRPGRLIETITVALPRPRLRSCTSGAEFTAMKERCLDLLHSQPAAFDDAA
jgi:ABC-type nitrate/sulfonate/bicarbonate transport system ATPase subunit